MNDFDWKIELIQQVDDKSCVAACMAMIAGVSINCVFEVMKDVSKTPYSELDSMCGLVRLGVLPIQVLGREFIKLGPYIATVPSLNIQGGVHAVVIDLRFGEMEVFDPQNGREGKRFYTKSNLSGSWCQLLYCKRVGQV